MLAKTDFSKKTNPLNSSYGKNTTLVTINEQYYFNLFD